VLVAAGGVLWWRAGGRPEEVVPQLAGRLRARAADDRAPRATDSAQAPAIRGAERADAPPARTDGRHWVPLDGAAPMPAAAREALAGLARRGGRAWQSLDADAAVGALGPLARVLPPQLEGVAVALDDDQLLVRGAISRRALATLVGDNAVTSMLGAALDGTDSLQLAGPIEPADVRAAREPGAPAPAELAWWRVRRLAVRGVPLPERLRVSVVGALRRAAVRSAPRGTVVAAARADALEAAVAQAPADALPLPLPRGVGDARVVAGRLTLYRNAEGGAEAPAKSAPQSSRSPAPSAR